MNGEDCKDRPDLINSIINGLERYNPEAVATLEDYLAKQCEERFIDCNANRTLLKLFVSLDLLMYPTVLCLDHSHLPSSYCLGHHNDQGNTHVSYISRQRTLTHRLYLYRYQLNPDRIRDEVITNVLVKAMMQFPSTQFSLALHLINPSAASQGELGEAVQKLRSLNALLQGAQYARFWATLDSDDLYADLVADISGFEELMRQRIAMLVAQACRELSLANMEQWLGLAGEAATKRFVIETARWSVDESRNVVIVPKNTDNEAKKTEIREDVSVDMFSRVFKRAWETEV